MKKKFNAIVVMLYKEDAYDDGNSGCEDRV